MVIVFCPRCVQGKEPSVRQLALLHFRNTIVLSVKLEDALSRPRARVPPSVTQMLLILQVGLQAPSIIACFLTHCVVIPSVPNKAKQHHFMLLSFARGSFWLFPSTEGQTTITDVKHLQFFIFGPAPIYCLVSRHEYTHISTSFWLWFRTHRDIL